MFSNIFFLIPKCFFLTLDIFMCFVSSEQGLGSDGDIRFFASLSRLEEPFCLGQSCQLHIFTHKQKSHKNKNWSFPFITISRWGYLLFTVFRTIYGWSQNNWNLFMVWGQVLPPAPPMGNSERIRDCQNKFLFRDILCKGGRLLEKHWETFKTFILPLGNIYFTLGKQLLAVK